MTVIRVEAGASGIGNSAGYDIVLGPFEAAAQRIADLAHGTTPILVSDPRVFALQGHRVAAAVGCAEPILVPEGEAAKDWDVLHRLLSQLAARNARRDTPIIALGGGSIGDVSGLAASLFKRGCPIVHLPTTLLSQADSAVGGKTAIDAFGVKNLIGTFHQPALVAVDPAFLDTLDARQIRSGYAEIVKYGLIDDPAFFAWCESQGVGVIAGHRDLRDHALATAIRAKARIVTGDFDDRSGRRALLNLGHSFAHAVESEAGLGRILHGEAVAIGIALAFRFSVELGHCPAIDADRVVDHLVKVGLPTRLSDAGLRGAAEKLLDWMARDKKNSGGAMALVLARGLGRAYLDRSVDVRRLATFLATAP